MIINIYNDNTFSQIVGKINTNNGIIYLNNGIVYGEKEYIDIDNSNIFFAEPVGRVDVDGNIYKRSTFSEDYIGKADSFGNIFKITELFENYIGKVFLNGDVYKQNKNFCHKLMGRVDIINCDLRVIAGAVLLLLFNKEEGQEEKIGQL